MLSRRARISRLLSIILAVLFALNATRAWSALQGVDRCPVTCPAHGKKVGCHGVSAGVCPHHQPARKGFCAPGCQHAAADSSITVDPAILPTIFTSTDAPLRQGVSLTPTDSIAWIALDPPFRPPPVSVRS